MVKQSVCLQQVSIRIESIYWKLIASTNVPYIIRNCTQVRLPSLRYLWSLELHPIAEFSEKREVPR